MKPSKKGHPDCFKLGLGAWLSVGFLARWKKLSDMVSGSVPRLRGGTVDMPPSPLLERVEALRRTLFTGLGRGEIVRVSWRNFLNEKKLPMQELRQEAFGIASCALSIRRTNKRMATGSPTRCVNRCGPAGIRLYTYAQRTRIVTTLSGHG